jgi:serine/threonine protein kinase
MNKKLGGALIGRGSFGCVFKPSLKCPGEKGGKEDVVSKVFFSEDSKKEAKDEININILINKIKDSGKWAHTWYKNCIPQKYEELYEDEPEIEDCLYDNDVTESDYDKYRRMLQGSYAGVTLLDLMNKDFKSSTFTDKGKFTNVFFKLMKLMKPLFIGLKEMYRKSISHNDIKDENIMVDGDGCKYIDFGLACEFKDKKFYEKRSKTEYIHDRIYPPYPYEYIFLYTYSELLKENDKRDIQLNIYRSLHDRYVIVHDQIFNRKSNDYIIQLIDRFINKGSSIKKQEGKNITSLIDTYSLGMLIPCILCKLAKKHGKMKQLKNLIKLNKIKSFIDLFKHMTEPDNFNRMKPGNVLDKYLELEKLYLNSSSQKEVKRKKRTKRR